jgi:hypothetical protein
MLKKGKRQKANGKNQTASALGHLFIVIDFCLLPFAF